MKDTAESYRREWALKTGRIPDDIFVPEHLQENGQPAPDPEAEAPRVGPDYLTAFIIVVDLDGNAHLRTDLAGEFTVARQASYKDAHRASRDIYDLLQARLTAVYVQMLAREETPEDRLREAARDRGLT